MIKLWLTYAWKDNEDEQIDFIIQALRAEGLDVGFDRARLVPGQRLWPQIDRAISDPRSSHAWAIYATKNSLSSEPCREELAIALDRALRTRESAFPIIGIFPEPLDRELIPSAIATRLYVSLREVDWAKRVAGGAKLTVPQYQPRAISPHYLHATQEGENLIIELRPRAGRWHPFVVLVLASQRERLLGIEHGPAGRPPALSLVFGATEVEADGTYKGLQIENPVDPLNSAYVYFSGSPTEIVFGERGQELLRVAPEALQ
jgi:hypothetical protein